MSTARFDDELWTDPKIEQLSPENKLLWIWFFTNPGRNYSGIYKFYKSTIKEQTGLLDTSIDRGMDTLIDTKLISYDPLFRVVFVKSMLKRQMSKEEGQEKLSEKQIKGIIKHLGTLHNCPLIQEFIDKYGYLGIEFNYTPIDTPIDTPMDIKPKSQPKSQSQSQLKDLSADRPADRPNGFNLNSLAQLWNNKKPPELPAVNLPFTRKPKQLAKLKDCLKRNPDLQFWEKLLETIHFSSFMRGKNNRGWKATFDFVVDKANEIMDGKYIDNGFNHLNRDEKNFIAAQQFISDMEDIPL